MPGPFEKVTVTLTVPESRGGVQFERGDEIEVYPNEARELAVLGRIEGDLADYAPEVLGQEHMVLHEDRNAASSEPAPSVDEISNQETKDASELQESTVSTDDGDEEH